PVRTTICSTTRILSSSSSLQWTSLTAQSVSKSARSCSVESVTQAGDGGRGPGACARASPAASHAPRMTAIALFIAGAYSLSGVSSASQLDDADLVSVGNGALPTSSQPPSGSANASADRF